MSYSKLSATGFPSAEEEKMQLNQRLALRPGTSSDCYHVELECPVIEVATTKDFISEWQLAVGRPELRYLSMGSFYLCQMATQGASLPSGGRTLVYANGSASVDGSGKPAIKPADGFRTIWRHEEEDGRKAWSVMRPTCIDPEYEALGDFFQCRDGQLDAERQYIGLVHRSLLAETGRYASFIWNSRGCASKGSVALWGLDAPGMVEPASVSATADQELRPFRAGPSYFKADAPAPKWLVPAWELAAAQQKKAIGGVVVAASKGWLNGLAGTIRASLCL